ncbi:MAG: apolipoprotein N-acyltransferase [Saprospiraceae bacterium]|nr:apolipoprotein N-acyltransferase [Saprospiraceae bacterium]
MKFHKNFLFIFLVLAGFAALYGGAQMLGKPFWGNNPIWLLLGTWMVIVLALSRIYWSDGRQFFYLIMSSLSGLLLGKAFVFTSPLLFVGFTPLLYAAFRYEHQGTCRLRVHGYYAFHAFMVWNIIATYWVANAALIPGLVAFLLNSLFMCIPWLLALQIKRIKPNFWLPAFVFIWLCYEWGHHQWEISWPWLSLGNGFAFYPEWIQWYEYTGAFGGSLWALVANVVVFASIALIRYRIYAIIALLIWLAMPVFISHQISKRPSYPGEAVEVGIVQPNYEPHFEKFSVDQNLQMIRFEKLSREVITANTRYLLWPETSFEYPEVGAFHKDWRISRMGDLCKMYGNTCLVTGLSTIRTFKEGEDLTDAARKSNKSLNSLYYEIQNSATQICAHSTDFPVYVKSKLVPGVETFPYRRWLPFLKPIVDKLGGSIHGLGKQKERAVFENGNLKIAPVICYESIYGAYIGDYIKKGAQAIFIMTNDGWWDNTPGYRQHLYFGALRAIEYRKPIARSANTGISCFIDAKGNILDATNYGKEAAIRRNMFFSTYESFYLKHGDYIIKLALLGALIILIISAKPFLRVRFSKNQ